jgi:hypothetical protein
MRNDPLTSSEPEPGMPPAPGQPQRPWRTWLIPAAAAVSVLLVIGPVVAGRTANPAGTSVLAGTTSVPPFYTQFGASNSASPRTLVIRSTATGAIVASAPAPDAPDWLLPVIMVAAGPGARTFYVAYQAEWGSAASVPAQIWIYRLDVGAHTLTRIKGGRFRGNQAVGGLGNMAVSPDGTQLALTADAAGQPSTDTDTGVANDIVVVDLRTGARTVWQGGLFRPGKTFRIPSVSWTADGRSIVFLAEWCNPDMYYNLCSGTMSGPDGYRDTQVRSLPVTGPGASTGGSLKTGSTLMLTQSRRYPVIETALAGPEPSELYLLVLSGTPGADGTWSQLEVDRVSATSHRPLGAEYNAATQQSGEGQVNGVMLGTDPGDQHLLLNYFTRQGFATGWIGRGALHVLPGAQSYQDAPMTAW